VKDGEKYSFTQGLSHNGKSVLFKVNVTITNEKGGGEATAALMYGLEGISTHVDLALRRGQIEVRYTLPQRDNVKISLFTGFGALIAQEVVGMQNAGAHTFAFDMNGLPMATYIVKVTTGSYREARPINITR
jgi:hypothetical protein